MLSKQKVYEHSRRFPMETLSLDKNQNDLKKLKAYRKSMKFGTSKGFDMRLINT